MNHLLTLLLLSLTLRSSFAARIRNEDDIGTFWHLTDFHVDLNYDQHDCTKGIGDYRCDSTEKLVNSALDAVDQLSSKQKPDFVVWGGDTGSHDKKLDKATLLKSLEFISQQMRTMASFAGVPILPVLGNHDVLPANNMSVDPDDPIREGWCHLLGTDPKYWAGWVNAPEQASTAIKDNPPGADFSKACYYSKLLQKPARLLFIGLNGLLWYQYNEATKKGGPDPIGQFDWLEKNLQWARETKTKVFVASHFPAGATDLDPSNYWHLEAKYNQQFVKLLQIYSDVIITSLVSHEHIDTFRVVLDDDCKPVGTMLLAPSVTPFYMWGVGDFNPRIRRYSYSRSLGSLLDYTQYWYNLSDFNSNWTVEYEAAKEYGLYDLNPSSLARLLDKFTTDDDKSGHWSAYWKHQLGGRRHDNRSDLSPESTCPTRISLCRCQHICALRHLDMQRLNDCLQVCKSDDPKLPTIAQRCSFYSNTVAVAVGSTLAILCVASLATALAVFLKRRRRFTV